MQEIPVVLVNPVALRASLMKAEYDINGQMEEGEFIRDLGQARYREKWQELRWENDTNIKINFRDSQVLALNRKG